MIGVMRWAIALVLFVMAGPVAVAQIPWQLGPVLPGLCRQGESFFLTTAVAGSQLYYCDRPNHWQLISSGGGGGGAANTDELTEGASNLYYTAARARAAFSGVAPISYDSGTGALSCPTCALAANLKNQTVRVGSTDQTQRAKIRFIAGTNVTITPADNAGGDSTDLTIAASGGGGGSLEIQANGSSVGTRAILDFLSSTGVTPTIVDTGTKITIQPVIDTAVIPTKANIKSGEPLYCPSSSASSTAYTCSSNPAFSTYTTGMVVNWKPDVNGAGGSTTLVADGLTSKAIKQADGTTNPSASDIVAGRLYPLWYDGTVFRLPGGGGGGTTVAKTGPYLTIGGVKYYGPGLVAVTTPDGTTFTDTASTSPTWTSITGGAVQAEIPNSSSNIRFRTASLGSNTTITWISTCIGNPKADQSTGMGCGAILRESSSGRVMFLETTRLHDSNPYGLVGGCFNSAASSSYTGTNFTTEDSPAPLGNVWRLVLTGGNWQLYNSASGETGTFALMDTWSATACGFSGAADQIGFGGRNTSTGSSTLFHTIFHWSMS